MSCGAGYPAKPCPFNFEGRVTRASCGACKHFIPPRHILAWCMLWDRDGVLCMRPISDCATCPEKASDNRPRDTVIDWKDPEQVAAYYRAKAKTWAGSNPDKRAETMARFIERNPDYFRKYAEKNRETLRENLRRHRAKVREAKNASQSGVGEVQPDSRRPGGERHEDLPTPRPDDDV